MFSFSRRQHRGKKPGRSPLRSARRVRPGYTNKPLILRETLHWPSCTTGNAWEESVSGAHYGAKVTSLTSSAPLNLYFIYFIYTKLSQWDDVIQLSSLRGTALPPDVMLATSYRMLFPWWWNFTLNSPAVLCEYLYKWLRGCDEEGCRRFPAVMASTFPALNLHRSSRKQPKQKEVKLTRVQVQNPAVVVVVVAGSCQYPVIEMICQHVLTSQRLTAAPSGWDSTVWHWMSWGNQGLLCFLLGHLS